jgi:TIGR03009 family protein
MSQHLAFRRLRQPRWIAVTLSGVFLAIGLQLFAQDQGLDPGITPNIRVGRSALTHPELHVEPADPQLDQLLQDWSDHTKRIKTLAGKHFKSTRDFAFGTETLAEGRFFVDMPDKGRIDVGTYTQPNPKPGDLRRYRAPNGKPTDLTIKSQKDREKWICDGKIVRVVDDGRREYEEIAIPPKQQGANMIDGPLPFLLGMPPEKAKARYHFRVIAGAPEGRVWIEVKPRFAMDASEWVRAYITLNLTSYLPENVRLLNPAETTETVYLFHDIEINENKPTLLQKWFGDDPFNPSLFRYHRAVHAQPAGSPKGSQNPDGPMMPLLIGAKSDQALRISKKLKQMGYEVQFEKGPSALTDDQVFRIESQMPEANVPLRPGQKIVLRYYDRVMYAKQRD